VADVTFVVTELRDLAPIRETLASLARVNSPHIDVEAEARLPHARFWVAAHSASAEPVAYALVWLVADEIEIIDVATTETQRRRGAARTLMSALLAEYRSRHSNAAFLEVRVGNLPAIQLYTGLGFEPTRTRRGYYDNGEDALEMRLDLASAHGETREVSSPTANRETPE
jgi:ribosomal-protein-alanine N-acetyltransferase